MSKALMFDMDGTIANLYGVTDWLDKLRNEDESPYTDASPLVDPQELADVLQQAKTQGYTVGVISWLAMGSSKEYDRKVRQAKRAWLDKHFSGVFDEVHFIKYGATKRQAIRKHADAVLVDDNARVRRGFNGRTIDATNSAAMMQELRQLVA